VLGREIVDGFMEQLRKAMATEDRVPPEDDFDAVTDAPPPPDASPASPPTNAHESGTATTTSTSQPQEGNTVEDDWRRAAQAEGFSPDQVKESWVWFCRYAFEEAPVLEERELRKARETMPDGVRRVLTRYPFYRFVGYDAEVLDDIEPIPVDGPSEQADARQFWEDVREARKTDAPNSAARRALERFARLVKLPSEHMRRLVDLNRATMMAAKQKPATMAATKRHLIQEAVVLSLAAAKKPIRIGQQKTKADPGHPITLKDIFGDDGLQDILPYVPIPESTDVRDRLEDARRERLIASLGGPFRPAHLADRAVYRNWLTKEIRLRTVEVLGEDLNVRDAARSGGSRREEVSYDETDSSTEVRYEVGPDTLALEDAPMPVSGDGEEPEGVARTTSPFMRRHAAWEKKKRIEDKILNPIDVHRRLERMRLENENAPQRFQYLALIRREPELFSNDVEAARRLGWKEKAVRDTKHLLVKAQKERRKYRFPNAL